MGGNPPEPIRLALAGFLNGDLARVRAMLSEQGLPGEAAVPVDGPALLEGLTRDTVDLLLVDDGPGRFTPEAALRLIRETGQTLPVLVWAENLSEVRAVSLLRGGAGDAFSWAQKGRLGPRVQALVRDARNHRRRARAEALLESTLQRQDLLMRSIPTVSFGARAGDLVRTWVAGHVEKLTGYPVDKFIGDSEFWYSRLHPDNRESARLARLSLREKGSMRMEYRWMHADGRYRWFLEQASIVRGVKDPGEVVGTWTDVSDRKTLEEQFLQAQKMEPLGRLAGGMVHDLNNLLTVVTGYCEMILTDFKEGAPLREELDQINGCARRATQLVGRLLAFSHRQSDPPRLVDPNALIQDLQKMLSRLIGDDITLVTALEPGVGRIRVDAGQMEQILLNLAVNARDAMPSGGQLTIETAAVPQMPGPLHAKTNIGPCVLIAVRDTGVGMDRETQRRLFEPFFTTKPRGQGTGLGLSTVRALVERSGGHIEVVSHLGLGTGIQMHFPAVWESAVDAPVAAEAIEMGPAGTETILLVEDDESVRSLAHRLLSRLGYHVLVAKDPGEAIIVAETTPRPIQLLLSDLIMPQMRGSQLAERLAKVRPDLKILFMSAHRDHEPQRKDFPALDHPLLLKPFRPAELAQRVRELLDGGTPRAGGPSHSADSSPAAVKPAA
ncbi:MAG: response regulator [Elusimicrobia bacterium]|nr:response regulator [Elusimicrobiota bacterium]